MNSARRVNPEQLKMRGCKTGGAPGVGDGPPSLPVGLPDDLARIDPSPRKETGKHVSPVVPAGSENLAGGVLPASGNGRNSRRASHLTAHDDQSFVEQAARGEVVEKAA